MPLFISRTAELMLKDLRGELTEEQEQKELQKVISENEEIRLLSNRLSDDNYVRTQLELMNEFDSAPGLKKLRAAGLIRSRKRHLWKYAAAAITVLSLAGGWYYLNKISYTPQPPEITNITPKTLPARKPESTHSHGYLELADKSKIRLDLVADGIIAYQDGSKVQIDGKHVRYEQMPTEAGLEFSTIRTEHNTIGVQYNNLVADSGGDFRLTLSDSTLVYLNSGSSIRFPVHFTGSERHIEIVGEAYFEVVENPSKPFVVTVGNAEIEVLGTHFNIKAHPGEPIITTVSTGTVKVSTDAKSKTLSPGQQIEVTKSGELGQIAKANIGQVTAWKDGIFDFNNEKLSVILSELGRWYKLDVDDRRKVQDERRAGIYPRSIPITELLGYLSVPAGIQLRLEGNKIVVY